MKSINHFEELQALHEDLLKRELAGGSDWLKDAQSYISKARLQSQHVSSPQEREQLRANIRYWANYVYQQTAVYPNTELAPFAGNLLEVERSASALSLKHYLLLLVIVLSFALALVWLLTPPAMIDTSQTLTPTSVLVIPAISPTSPPAPATSRPTSTPITIIIPTETTTFTPTSTGISIPTEETTFTPPAVTPTPNHLNFLSNIAPENISELTIIQRLSGHLGPVLHVAFSSDGKLLATSGADGDVRVWALSNISSPPEVINIDQTGWTQIVTFSPNGKWLAAGGNDRIVELWNVSNIGQPFAQFQGHEGFIFGLSFNLDSTVLASGSGDGELRLWNIESGSLITAIKVGESAILEIAYSPNNSLLAVANLNDGFKLLTLPTLQTRCSLKDKAVLTTAFSDDGNTIVIGTKAGEVILLNFECQSQTIFQVHTDFVNGVAISPNGNVVVSGSRDGTLMVIPGSIPLIGHQSSIESVAFSPDGKLIASASADGTIILWGVLDH